MKVFLIILAVLAVITAIILSLSAEFTIIFDNGWTTRVRVLFIEKDVELSKILSFLLFPEKAAEDVAAKAADEVVPPKAKEPVASKVVEEDDGPTMVAVVEAPASEEKVDIPPPDENNHLSDEEIQQIVKELAASEEAEDEPPAELEKPQKKNFIKKLWDEEGIVGMLELVTNLLETANSAITTLIKGLHIYSLYVKMIIGGGDAADIAEKFGSTAGYYYPIKGIILNQMKVDRYDDYIDADFIAPRSEYEFQLIAGMNVALLMKVALRAGRVFLINLIKNKKSK